MLVGSLLFVAMLLHPIAMGADGHRPAPLDPDPGPGSQTIELGAPFACFDVLSPIIPEISPLPAGAILDAWPLPPPLIPLTTTPPAVHPPRVRRALLQVYRI